MRSLNIKSDKLYVGSFLGVGLGLVFCFMALIGCAESATDEELKQELEQRVREEKNPVVSIISGTFANVYRYCDGTNLIYYSERYNAVALQVLKDGCNSGR